MGYYPGRFAVGTAKRVVYTMKAPRSEKTAQTIYGWLMTKLIDYLSKKSHERAEKKRIAKKHNVKFM